MIGGRAVIATRRRNDAEAMAASGGDGAAWEQAARHGSVAGVGRDAGQQCALFQRYCRCGASDDR